MTDLKGFITKGILTAMALVSIGSASLGIVKANNWEDTAYEFSFDYNDDWTDVRQKEDDSASYMKCIEAYDEEKNHDYRWQRIPGEPLGPLL